MSKIHGERQSEIMNSEIIFGEESADFGFRS
jgi:hypothetical protein